MQALKRPLVQLHLRAGSLSIASTSSPTAVGITLSLVYFPNLHSFSHYYALIVFLSSINK